MSVSQHETFSWWAHESSRWDERVPLSPPDDEHACSLLKVNFPILQLLLPENFPSNSTSSQIPPSQLLPSLPPNRLHAFYIHTPFRTPMPASLFKAKEPRTLSPQCSTYGIWNFAQTLEHPIRNAFLARISVMRRFRLIIRIPRTVDKGDGCKVHMSCFWRFSLHNSLVAFVFWFWKQDEESNEDGSWCDAWIYIWFAASYESPHWMSYSHESTGTMLRS